MHCHLYLVSTSLVPPFPNSVPLGEHNQTLTYENSPLPIITSTIYFPSTTPFRILCSRVGDASDVDVTDLSFECFIDGQWISSTSLRQRPESRTKVTEQYVTGLRVSRTTIRPFTFTRNLGVSLVEILVRTGEMLPPWKPAKAEKGLQEISSRDSIINPIFLAPLVQEGVKRVENPAKRWVDDLKLIGRGSVGLLDAAVTAREVKMVGWKSLRNLVLFRFRCVKTSGVPVGPGVSAGWVMENKLTVVVDDNETEVDDTDVDDL